MKIEFEITYDAGKLHKEIKSIVKDTVKGFGTAYVEGSKKAIEKGDFISLRKSTIDIRRAGTSRRKNGKLIKGVGNTKYKQSISSTKPLQHTKRLLNGIKQLKNGDMSVHEYGTFHLGDLQTAEQIEKKSGTAYTTASDSMIPNKKVPIRNWFQMDLDLAKKAIKKFDDLVQKNFIRKTSLKFTRFKG